MRIAAIADVHGNHRALTAVLADIDRHAPDLVVDLGDCLSGPLAAAETAELLMVRAFPTVRGNHDRQLVAQAPSEMGPSDAHARRELTDRHLAWIRTFPPTLEIDGVLLCHGNPHADQDYLIDSVEAGRLRESTAAEIRARLGHTAARLVLCGHSHFPRSVQPAAGPLIVNPGSVGLPAFETTDIALHVAEAGTPHARWALLERRASSWRAEHRQVEYDWTAASEDAERNGRPDWAHALRTGRALPSVRARRTS